MAIAQFRQGSGSTDLSAFYQWLSANSTGTFLEGLTMANTTTTNTNDTITISDSGETVTIMANQGNHVPVFEYTTGDYVVEYGTQAATGATAYVTGALLCSKGLIIQYVGSYLSYSDVNYYGIAITVDSNGKLASITNQSLIPAQDETITTWNAVAAGSTDNAQRKCRPLFGASLTSLAQITAQGIDNTLTLPYAYAAISTQINAEGLYSVLIDGASYISNGVWYIRDAG